MRLAAVWLTGSTLFGISRTADSILEGVILIGAALASIGIIWIKGVQPAAVFMRRLSEAVDALFDLRDWQGDMEHWKGEVDRRLGHIEQSLEAQVTVRHEVVGVAGEQGPAGPPGPQGMPHDS